ncbi:MAG: hypothetical protein R6V48_01865, partial [Fidelibacterota bacterium]
MKRITHVMTVFLTVIGLLSCGGPSQTVKKTVPSAFIEQGKRVQNVYLAAHEFLDRCKSGSVEGVEMERYAAIDTLELDTDEMTLDIYFNRHFAYRPLREENVADMYQLLENELGNAYRNYTITMYSTGVPIHKLIPNYYIGEPSARNREKLPKIPDTPIPVVRNNSKPYMPSKGLNGRTIALWNSHGWYYENSLDRWEWQRARNFQIVEDIFPTAYVLKYLVPMLENAGANTFLPHERDINTNEVIVDNDDPGNTYIENGKWEEGGIGFAVGEKPYTSGD